MTAQTIEQKSAMLDRVLNHFVAARIASSQNEHARKHFATARELLSHARDLPTPCAAPTACSMKRSTR